MNSELETLKSTFPSADPGFLLECLQYQSEWNPTSNAVKLVIEKLNEFENYPSVSFVQTILEEETIRKTWEGEGVPIRGGKGKSREIDLDLTRNKALVRLSTIFPFIDIREIKAQLLTSPHSPLFKVAEKFLSSSSPKGTIEHPTVLTRSDFFRSSTYLSSLKSYIAVVQPTFPSSVIERISQSSSDWPIELKNYQKNRSKIGKWFYGLISNPKKSSEIIIHPELQDELDQILPPSKSKISKKRVGGSAKITCECCYDDVYLVDTINCQMGHRFCTECISRFVAELAHGSGGDLEVKCFSLDDCSSRIPIELLKSVLDAELYISLEVRKVDFLAEELLASGAKLRRCPFCSYFEIEESSNYFFKYIRSSSHPFSFIIRVLLLFPLFLIVLLVAFIIPEQFDQESDLKLFPLLEPHRVIYTTYSYLSSQLESLQSTVNTFQCRNGPNQKALPTFGSLSNQAYDYTSLLKFTWPGSSDKRLCGKLSCTKCSRDLSQISSGISHRCHSEQDEFRQLLELAKTYATARTCPNCSILIVKSDGCNRITCRCKELICYSCRLSINSENYQHFCQHFRSNPNDINSCSICDKCDLYRLRDEKLEIEIAVEKVKKNFVLNLGENRNRNVGRGNIVDVDDNFDGRVVLDRFVKRVLKFL